MPHTWMWKFVDKANELLQKKKKDVSLDEFSYECAAGCKHCLTLNTSSKTARYRATYQSDTTLELLLYYQR